MRGRVIVYTGNGQGKTTASLGVALRSIAHGKKVVIIQFMKGRKDTGEYLIRKELGNYEIYQFGREGFVDLSNPSEEDKNIAREGLEFAGEKLKEEPHLMILDEINIASKIGLVSVDDVINLIKRKPKKTTIILTGRYADQRIVDIADMVTEMREIKRRDISPLEGIEF
ncbi:MAG TPA: cob(I)yrinic acid a,c-diamide adenosyltransferase [Thermoplasmatales archaeon]|nr:cob(I)yrinic acid a,c-diamide adenosyltransferase [Thermoplasmatales archaeon]